MLAVIPLLAEGPWSGRAFKYEWEAEPGADARLAKIDELVELARDSARVLLPSGTRYEIRRSLPLQPGWRDFNRRYDPAGWGEAVAWVAHTDFQTVEPWTVERAGVYDPRSGIFLIARETT